MSDSDVVLPGTASAKAIALEKREFGASEKMVVLLHGPREELDQQGPKLARRLDRITGVETMSAWSPGAERVLWNGNDDALIIVRSKGSINHAIHKTLPQVRQVVEWAVGPPIVARVTGPPPLGEAMISQNIDGTRRAELISGPLVLIVLLLVFRSPIAAIIPALLGFSVAFAGHGIIALLGDFTRVDSLALSMISGMGLALGVDYSLLIISRFREELGNGLDSRAAAMKATATAGRTVQFAGLVLTVSMILAFLIAPGMILESALFGIIGATLLAQAIALIVLPPALILIGGKINLWRIEWGRKSVDAARISKKAISRPVLATIVVVIPLLAIAMPARAIKFGAPSPENLPKDNKARIDFEYLKKTFGLGWTGPFEITVVSRHGPITDLGRLRELRRFQLKVARLPGVSSVMGPGLVSKSSSEAGKAAGRLKGSINRLPALDDGLDKVAGGTKKLTDGISSASKGSSRLATGLSSGAAGARSLNQGLNRASAGLNKLSRGLGKSKAGSTALEDALGKTVMGIKQLARGLESAEYGAYGLSRSSRRLSSGLASGNGRIAELQNAASDAESRLRSALESMESMRLASKTDPEYRKLYTHLATALALLSGRDPTTGGTVRHGYMGLDSALDSMIAQTGIASAGSEKISSGAERLKKGLKRLNDGTAKLSRAIDGLTAGEHRLSNGIARLHSGGKRLQSGTSRLDSGSQELVNGFERMHRGASTLKGGLAKGESASARLNRGVDKMSDAVGKLLTGSPNGGSIASTSSALSSGYFILGLLDKSPRKYRQVASHLINIDRGGSALRITVLPRKYSGGASKDSMNAKLTAMSNAFGKKINAEAAVGGNGAVMQDYKDRTNGKLLPMIVALLAATFIILMVMFRSLLIALKSVLLNLLTLVAAMGVLSLTFTGKSPIFGGPGYLEITSFFMLYATIFALSMDYEVFIISRMREYYLRTGSNDAAIDNGISSTAGIITGAVMIMIAIFASFAFVGIGQWAQFGVGLIAALIIDATAIRLVLLPATMRLLGRANWWLPSWLDRLLPKLNEGGTHG